jgi:hypothetical protein
MQFYTRAKPHDEITKYQSGKFVTFGRVTIRIGRSLKVNVGFRRFLPFPIGIISF